MNKESIWEILKTEMRKGHDGTIKTTKVAEDHAQNH